MKRSHMCGEAQPNRNAFCLAMVVVNSSPISSPEIWTQHYAAYENKKFHELCGSMLCVSISWTMKRGHVRSL